MDMRLVSIISNNYSDGAACFQVKVGAGFKFWFCHLPALRTGQLNLSFLVCIDGDKYNTYLHERVSVRKAAGQVLGTWYVLGLTLLLFKILYSSNNTKLFSLHHS